MTNKELLEKSNELLEAIELLCIFKVDDEYIGFVRDCETYDMYVKKCDSLTRLAKEIADLDEEILMIRDFVGWFQD